MIHRILTLIKKEFEQLRRSPVILRMLLIMPIMQMFIFGYAAVMDIQNIDTVILDKSNSMESRNLINNFKSSNYFRIKYFVQNEKEIASKLDSEKALVALVIPPDFSDKIKSRKTADVQVIVDGTNTNAASVAMNYSASIIMAYSNDIMKSNGIDPSKMGTINIQQRFFFNPALENKYFFIPGIFAMIILVLGMPMTGMSIVKEKEQGTIEQLMVTPIQSTEIILGKVIPYTIIILISSTGILLISLLWFKLPLRGSLINLYLLMLIFLINALGFGIFLSTISQTQQQAILSSFFITMPMILFSGFMFPVSNMPPVFKILADINPMRYFLECSRDIFLKGVSFEILSHKLAIMSLIALIVFSASILAFKKKLD